MGNVPEKGNGKAEFSGYFFKECFLIYMFAEEHEGEDYIIIPVFTLGMFVMHFILLYISFHKLPTTSKM